MPLHGSGIRPLTGFRISPDGAHVVFEGDTDPSAGVAYELFAAPIGGGPTQSLSGPLVAGGRAVDFEVTPDSIGVVFLADKDVNEVFELFATPFGGVRFGLGPPLAADRDVLDFAISPDDLHVVYRADSQANDRFELHRVAISGGASRVLNGPLAPGGDVHAGYSVAPGSGHVAYLADELLDQVAELFSVRIQGLLAPVRVNGDLVAGPAAGEVTAHRVTPDGGTVVYEAGRITDATRGLYRVPIGGGEAVRLSARFVTNGQLVGWDLTADGRHVVYLASQENANADELFGVPLDGSAPVRKLNHELAPSLFRDVLAFAPVADGQRVVYHARQGSDSRLYVARLDGSEPPLALTPDLDGLVEPHRITPDGAPSCSASSRTSSPSRSTAADRWSGSPRTSRQAGGAA